jgi:hypothetical protein
MNPETPEMSELKTKLKITKEDEADANRIFGAAARAGRPPTDAETYELAMLKFIRDELATGKMKIAKLREQFGGIDRERTIRNAAKAIAYYTAQVEVFEEDGRMGVTVPPGLRETMAALRDDDDK